MEHRTCLYTKQKHQKRKTWHDGKLTINTSSSRITLYNAPESSSTLLLHNAAISNNSSSCVLDALDVSSKNVISNVLQGNIVDLELERYLVTVTGPWVEPAKNPSITQNSTNSGNNNTQNLAGGKNMSAGVGGLGARGQRRSKGMETLMKRKFRIPAKKVFQPSNNGGGTGGDGSNSKLAGRKRPLQPGEWQRVCLGQFTNSAPNQLQQIQNEPPMNYNSNNGRDQIRRNPYNNNNDLDYPQRNGFGPRNTTTTQTIQRNGTQPNDSGQNDQRSSSHACTHLNPRPNNLPNPQMRVQNNSQMHAQDNSQIPIHNNPQMITTHRRDGENLPSTNKKLPITSNNFASNDFDPSTFYNAEESSAEESSDNENDDRTAGPLDVGGQMNMTTEPQSTREEYCDNFQSNNFRVKSQTMNTRKVNDVNSKPNQHQEPTKEKGKDESGTLSKNDLLMMFAAGSNDSTENHDQFEDDVEDKAFQQLSEEKVDHHEITITENSSIEKDIEKRNNNPFLEELLESEEALEESISNHQPNVSINKSECGGGHFEWDDACGEGDQYENNQNDDEEETTNIGKKIQEDCEIPSEMDVHSSNDKGSTLTDISNNQCDESSNTMGDRISHDADKLKANNLETGSSSQLVSEDSSNNDNDITEDCQAPLMFTLTVASSQSDSSDEEQ